MELPCLHGFITPRIVCAGATPVASKSGLHVEDLPGISCESLAAVEPGKYLNAQVFIDEKMRFAAEMILTRIKAHLEPYVEERGSREAGSIGTWADPADYAAGVATKVGVRVRVEGGAMLMPTVPRVWIQCEDAIDDLVLKVKDGDTIHEFAVEVEAATETEVWLNFEPKSKEVDIYVEDVRFKPMQGDAQGTRYFSSCTGCGSGGLYHGIAGGGLVGEVESSALHGIRAEVVLLCSIDRVACIMLKRFKLPMLYQFGVLVLQEWDASSRTNYFTVHSREWAKETWPYWDQVVIPREMKIPAKGLASFISQLDPACLKCGTGPSYGNAHP